MSDNRVLIPQVPSTVDERRAAIETRLRERYPDLDIRVDLAGDVYSITASCSVGSFTEEASVHNTANNTIRRLRSYFRDLAEDYAAHLNNAPADSPDERRARLEETVARVRVLATHKAPTISTRVADLLVLLEAAEHVLDVSTPELRGMSAGGTIHRGVMDGTHMRPLCGVSAQYGLAPVTELPSDRYCRRCFA
jgi:hypothetical protein